MLYTCYLYIYIYHKRPAYWIKDVMQLVSTSLDKLRVITYGILAKKSIRTVGVAGTARRFHVFVQDWRLTPNAKLD